MIPLPPKQRTILHELSVISVHSGPKNFWQCLSYFLQVFSHAHEFNLQSLLPVQV